MDRLLEIYHENLDDYKKLDISKKDSFMSKFNQEECNKQIEYYFHKIEVVNRIKSKIRA